MNKIDISVRLGFVLLPQFAMGAFAAFADLLGLLDAQTDTAGPCAWEVVADTLIPVRSASGIAAAIAFLMSDGAAFMTGQTLYVDGGASIGRAAL